MLALDEALDSIALSGRNLCNRSCDISAMLARQQSSPLHPEGFHHSQKGGGELKMPAQGGRRGSTLLLLDCTAYVNSIYLQGVKTTKHFWLSPLTKATSHPNQLKEQKYSCGSCDTNFLQCERIASRISPPGSRSTIPFSLYEMLLKA